jgi:hypothetical protein
MNNRSTEVLNCARQTKSAGGHGEIPLALAQTVMNLRNHALSSMAC